MCTGDIINTISEGASDVGGAIYNAAGDIVDSAGNVIESAADRFSSIGGDALDAAGNIIDSAGNVIAGPALTANVAGNRFGLKPIGFGGSLVFTPDEQTIGDALELGKQEIIDPVVEGVVEPIISAPFNTALGLTEDVTQGVLGPSAQVLGTAGGFYPASDQLGDVSPALAPSMQEAPVQAQYDPRGADFLRDPRDRRYLNTRNTLLTGSRGVTGTPSTTRKSIFGNRNFIDRLGG